MTDDLAWGPVRDASGTIIAAARGDYRAKMAAVDHMLAALLAAQEALFWYKGEAFEATGANGQKVGDQIAAAIAKAEATEEQPAHVDR